MDRIEQKILEIIEKNADKICAFGQDIWTHAELGFQEFRTSGKFQEEMDKLGADTNGLNLNIATVYDPNDSTSLDPLQFNEVYLSSEPLESTATTKAPTTEAPKTTAALPQTTASVSSDPDVSSTTSETTQTTTTTSAVGTQETAGNSTKPSDVREEKPQKSKWLYWILGVAGLVLLAGAGTAVWYWQRKKKRNG